VGIEKMLVLENVEVNIDEHMILNQINLNWSKGEAIAVCGANGAGKSTLLKACAGLLQPSSGTVGYPDRMNLQQWRRSLGVIFPESFLYEKLTARENLDFYRRLYGVKDKHRAEQLLDDVRLSHVHDEFVRSFSKGMKQRLSIARALLHNPPFLLLDEPFEGLDVESQSFLEQWLKELKEHGTGILLVNHNIQQAWKICDRAVLLHQGRVVIEKKCHNESFHSFMNVYRGTMKENNGAIFK
jgi:heme exporter protein A